MAVINLFADENEFLSNFYGLHQPIHYGNLSLRTSEHLYQVLKTLDMKEREIVAFAPKPGDAKRAGYKVTLRSDWNTVKVDIMMYVLRRKFSDDRLRLMLLNTGDATLIEGNYHHDNFWGDCFCKNCKNKVGLNILGRLLEQLRAELRIIG